MSRLWLPFGRRVLVLLTLLAALVLLFPMRLAVAALGVGRQGVTARDVSGSVWSGRFEDLSLSGISLGTVDAGLSPLDLLIGRARIEVDRGDQPSLSSPLVGALLMSRNMIGVDHVSAVVPLAIALAPLPIGSVTLTDFGARFVGGACERANGGVRATLATSLAGVVVNEGLGGNAVCDGRYLRLPLASASGRERLDLRLAESGEYIADVIAVEPDVERVAALAALGFTAVPGGYRLRVTGRL